VFVLQGLVMGLYSIAAALLATYLWAVIAIDVVPAPTVSTNRRVVTISAVLRSRSA
jgi:Ycf4.